MQAPSSLPRLRPAVLVATGVLVPACASSPAPWLLEDSLDQVEAWAATPVDVTGRVLDEEGAPVAEAGVRVGDRLTVTDQAGTFRLAGLPRANDWLVIEADGFRPRTLGIHLATPLDSDVVEVTVMLIPRWAGSTRFLFTGDVAMGRRFLDTDDSTPRGEMPPDDPNAWIQVSDPVAGSLELVRFVEPLFASADYPVVNLESPVTDDPATPHEEKEYAFFTLPGSLAALRALGVRGVGLGNNHVYDYLDAGVADTLRHVDEAGLSRAGVGMDEDEAWSPWCADLEGRTYGFVSATSVTGYQFDIDYVASEEKAGAADLTQDGALHDTIASVLVEGRTPIAMLHGGVEHSWFPSDFIRERFSRAIADGAALVVGHHPHVGQGFSEVDGALVAWSLGNFLLDQERLETFLGEVLLVDQRGRDRLHAEVIPIVLDAFRPLGLSGETADRFLRTLAESTEAPLAVVSQAGTGWILDTSDPRIESRDREVVVPVLIPPGTHGVVDLRELAHPGESLARAILDARAEATGRVGRDLLGFGSFEDDDVDGEILEASRWELEGESRALCVEAPHRGTAALCSFRDDRNHQDSVTAFRHRVRFRPDALGVPGTDLTVLSWVRGSGAGEVSLVTRWAASEGEREFGGDTCEGPSGSFDWTLLACDLAAPEGAGGDPERDPGAIRLRLHHAPPDQGSGVAVFDDVAVVSWEEPLDLVAGADLEIPHGRDFLKIWGEPGLWNLHLVFRSLALRETSATPGTRCGTAVAVPQAPKPYPAVHCACSADSR
ncbi:MAG: CapA family protein [Deltaproteobacteria bacterium]|nr:CapA family protein [Deltaproteobacteria bacterium]